MAYNILEARDLEFEYPDGTKALRGFTGRFEKGKKTAVMGGNGAGKSTLFLCMNGILKHTGGSLLFRGKELKYGRTELNELRKSVGIVFQDPDSQLFSSSVSQEVSFGPINLKLDEGEVRRRVNTALEQTGISELRNRPVHFISYGQKKRVTIADILAMEPEVIILDEPTASLDPLHTGLMLELFEELAGKGITLVMSTHDVNLAYSWADRIILMKDGAAAAEGGPGEIFSNSGLLETCGLAKPLILEVYDELRLKGGYVPAAGEAAVRTGNQGGADGRLPRSRQELVDMIREMRFDNA